MTCITWPSEHPTELVFGTAEGKMKIGQLKTNKSLTMYTTGSYTVACCSRYVPPPPMPCRLPLSARDGDVCSWRFLHMKRQATTPPAPPQP